MGCGCGKKKSVYVAPVNKNIPVEYGIEPEVMSLDDGSGCEVTIADINNIDIDIIKLYRKTKSSVWLQVNRELRLFVKHYKTECPDEIRILEIKTMIDGFTVDNN